MARTTLFSGAFSILLCLVSVNLFLSGTLAAPSTPQCSIVSLNNLIQEGRQDNEELVDILGAFSKVLSNFEIIENRLAGVCMGFSAKRTKVKRFLGLIQPATHIPKLNVLIKPVQKLGSRLDSAVLKNPTENLCRAVSNTRNFLDKVESTFGVVSKKLRPFLKIVVDGYDAIDRALDIYSSAGGRSGSECTALNGLCTGVRKVVDLQNELVVHMRQLVSQSSAVDRILKTADSTTRSAADTIEDIFGGVVGDILEEVENLMTTEESIPIPRGSKSRGVGVIPHCCPSGYSNTAGLCYPNCRSGYDTVLFTCLQQCRRGWTDIGVTCTRVRNVDFGLFDVQVPEFDSKDVYERFGRIPAVFGSAACSCRGDKRYLEAGLCYNKCGRDAFAGHGTSFLTECLDLRHTKLSIADLAENLNVFEKAKKIPVLGEAIKFIDDLIDDVFSTVTGEILKVASVNGPSLILSTVLPPITSLTNLAIVVDMAVAHPLNDLANALVQDKKCKA